MFGGTQVNHSTRIHFILWFLWNGHPTFIVVYNIHSSPKVHTFQPSSDDSTLELNQSKTQSIWDAFSEDFERSNSSLTLTLSRTSLYVLRSVYRLLGFRVTNPQNSSLQNSRGFIFSNCYLAHRRLERQTHKKVYVSKIEILLICLIGQTHHIYLGFWATQRKSDRARPWWCWGCCCCIKIIIDDDASVALLFYLSNAVKTQFKMTLESQQKKSGRVTLFWSRDEVGLVWLMTWTPKALMIYYDIRAKSVYCVVRWSVYLNGSVFGIGQNKSWQK